MRIFLNVSLQPYPSLCAERSIVYRHPIMKAFFLPLTLIGVAALSSCVNPQSTASTNRFGYQGTVTGATDGAPAPGPPATEVAANQPGNNTAPGGSAPAPINLDDTPAAPSGNTASAPAPSDNTPAPPSNIASNNESQEKPAADKPEPKLEIPYAIPVPGKEGLVYSPHNKNAGHADVRGMKPGVIVEDPYAPGKYFRVP